MTITIVSNTSRPVSLDEYVEHVKTRVDLQDDLSIAESAHMLRGLANDRLLVVQRLNDLVRNAFRRESFPSAQAIFLARGENFYVRAGVWPSTADIAGGRLYQDRFAYNQAHDHNFTFMTVNYVGPGYETDLYEYDYEKVQGYIGEPVEIRHQERIKFGPGMVMLYRASRDLHIQHPPEELTITLNLVVGLPETRMRDQMFFDVQNKIISEFPAETDASRRVSFLSLAAHFGNEDTRGLLTDLSRAHPCRRTRLSACEALARQQPTSAAQVWESATSDPEPLVVNIARKKLAEIESTA